VLNLRRSSSDARRVSSFVRRIADAAIEANCSPVVVVIASGSTAVREQLNPTAAITVENTIWNRGVGTSIRTGVQHLVDNGADVDAIVLLVCDRPFVNAAVIGRLIALREKTQQPIVASSYAKTFGVPALFDRSCFGDLLALNDSSGAKSIILANRGHVAEFPFAEGKIDIDRAEDLEGLIAERNGGD
jgi:molybdenum cofactor cytidylyltransferase